MITKNDSTGIEQSADAEHNLRPLTSRAATDGYSRRRGLLRLGAATLLATLAVGVLMKSDAHGQPAPLQIIPLAQAYSPDHNVILHLKGPTDVLQTELIFQQRASTGWHYHPGPVVVMIATGALTEIHSNGCMTVHQAGSAFFEDANVVHNVVNYAGVVTEVYATFLSPTGAQPLIPAADPGSVCRN